MPPGNGVIDVGQLGHGLHRTRAGREHRRVRLAEHKQIAAAHRFLGETGLVLADELPAHHRNAPIAAAADDLGHLPAVAEEAQGRAELQLLLAFEPGKAGRARARQHALADAVAQLLLELVGIHGEEQHGDAGPSVGRLLLGERALDAGFRAAGDHRGGEAGHGARGDHRPFQRGRRDDDPRADHGKGLGKRLDNRDAFDFQLWHVSSSSRGSSRNGRDDEWHRRRRTRTGRRRNSGRRRRSHAFRSASRSRAPRDSSGPT